MKISASIWALQLWWLSTFVNASVSKNLRASRNLVEASDATSNPQGKLYLFYKYALTYPQKTH